jgi:hypothetical protein
MYDIIIIFLLYLSLLCVFISMIPPKIFLRSPDLADALDQDEVINFHLREEGATSLPNRRYLSPCLSCDKYVDPIICAGCLTPRSG